MKFELKFSSLSIELCLLVYCVWLDSVVYPRENWGVWTPKFVKHGSQNWSKNVKKSQKGASPHRMSLQGVIIIIIIIIKLFTLGEAK